MSGRKGDILKGVKEGLGEEGFKEMRIIKRGINGLREAGYKKENLFKMRKKKW